MHGDFFRVQRVSPEPPAAPTTFAFVQRNRSRDSCVCADSLCARRAAAGAGRRDGPHAKPAAERGGGPRKPPGAVRGVCVSQREALPVQGRRHLHLQRGPGLLDRRRRRSSISSHTRLSSWRLFIVGVVVFLSLQNRSGAALITRRPVRVRRPRWRARERRSQTHLFSFPVWILKPDQLFSRSKLALWHFSF